MKKILITGCSSGFGYDASKYLADKGHHVYATMRNSTSKNKKSADELREYASSKSLKIEVLDMDVTSDESVKEAVAQISGVDVLINNAGVGFGGTLEAFSSQQFLDQLNLNIVGTHRVAKAVLPTMRAQKSGLIIQVSSTAGRAAFPGFGVYCSSKWGLEGMSEALRYELGPLGIDTVIVEPGPFSTDFFTNIINAEDAEVNEAYGHVNGFMEGFGQQVNQMYEDENAPTDPMIVVELFEDLINMPAGSRPIRTIAGLDFGYQAFNDATEPIRKAGIAAMGFNEWDGPSS